MSSRVGPSLLLARSAGIAQAAVTATSSRLAAAANVGASSGEMPKSTVESRRRAAAAPDDSRLGPHFCGAGPLSSMTMNRIVVSPMFSTQWV